jgi:hypothetical protein
MEQHEAEYFKWLLRKCKVNLNTEQHKGLIAELDDAIKKLVGTYGNKIDRYEEPEPKKEEVDNGNINDSNGTDKTV